MQVFYLKNMNKLVPVAPAAGFSFALSNKKRGTTKKWNFN